MGAAELGVTLGSHRLLLGRERTEQELILLAEFTSQRWLAKQIAHELGRTTQGIHRMARKTRMLSLLKRKWLPHEDAFLVEQLAADRPLAEIAAELGRTKGSVEARLTLIDLRRRRYKPSPCPRRGWTTSEDRLVADRKARGFRAGAIAKELGRTLGAVRARLRLQERAAA